MTASLSGKNNTHGFAISSIIRAFRCPRQFYFQKNTDWNVSGKYIICKQVSIAGPDITEEELWNTICLIHPAILPEERPFFTACTQTVKTAPLRSWTELDVTIRSEKLGIYGLLDKYDARSGEYTITKCTKAPKTGCWPEDQIRTTALLLCIEETGPKKPTGMYIEYIPSGIIRYYVPTPRDRRKILYLIQQLKKIEKGEFPPKPMYPPCSRCLFEKRCNECEPRRLSGLFKKR